MKFALFSSGLLAIAIICLTNAEPKTDSELPSYLSSSPGPKSIIVSFHGTPIPEIIRRYSRSSPDKIPQLLQENTDRSQASTLQLLESRKVLKASGSSYSQIWCSNKLVIDDADTDLVEQLKKVPEVAKIEADLPIVSIPVTVKSTTQPPVLLAWGVVDVNAHKVWSEKNITGKGVVVGIIGTGVRATHRDIAAGFRKEYGWFDAVNGKAEPYDDDGRGTHVIGMEQQSAKTEPVSPRTPNGLLAKDWITGVL